MEEIRKSVSCARCGEPIQGAPVCLGGNKFYDAECAEAVVAEAKVGHEQSIAPGTGEEVEKVEGELPLNRETEDRDEEKASRGLPEREALKAIGIGEFECTECHQHFLVEHLPNGKHKLQAIRQEEP
jgi:hypothetical protein